MRIRNLLLAAGLLAGSVFAFANPSAATPPVHDPASCTTPAWFVNPDEADREPERTEAGLVFEKTDLIHHNAPDGLTVEKLGNGDFHATPLPDQDSFFSVEVSDEPGGYATLRWSVKTKKWEMTTGGQFYENEDPAKLVDMPPAKKSHKVVRFGVGYTKTPAGSVKTTVSSVSFQGKAYDLTCPAPKPEPTETVTPKPTGTTATPKPTKTTATPVPIPNPPAAGPTLPVTGAGTTPLIGLAVFAIALGAVSYYGARRKRRRFEV